MRTGQRGTDERGTLKPTHGLEPREVRVHEIDQLPPKVLNGFIVLAFDDLFHAGMPVPYQLDGNRGSGSP